MVTGLVTDAPETGRASGDDTSDIPDRTGIDGFEKRMREDFTDLDEAGPAMRTRAFRTRLAKLIEIGLACFAGTLAIAQTGWLRADFAGADMHRERHRPPPEASRMRRLLIPAVPALWSPSGSYG
jgi:hypothetical protein